MLEYIWLILSIIVVNYILKWYSELEFEQIFYTLGFIAFLPYLVLTMNFLSDFCWDYSEGSMYIEYLPLIGGIDIGVIAFLAPMSLEAYSNLEKKFNFKCVPFRFDSKVQKLVFSHSLHLALIITTIFLSNREALKNYFPVWNSILLIWSLGQITYTWWFTSQVIKWQTNFEDFTSGYLNEIKKEFQKEGFFDD